MGRVMLRVAYDGTEYCGWQVQPNGVTVEAVLNRELSTLLGKEIAVIGASRTDSGVHALGNVCVFDTESRIPAEKFSYALNARLPRDIVVQESREVPADFHPRHCDCRKTYEYRIYSSVFPNPLLGRYSHFIYRQLDVEAMRQAALYLQGEHDFKSFCSVNTQVKETVRTIYSIVVSESPEKTTCPIVDSESPEKTICPTTDSGSPEKTRCPIVDSESPERLIYPVSAPKDARKPGSRMITIQVNGNGFLYNMVRIIAGTLIEVGYGWRKPEEVKEILEAKDRARAGATAPACGLTLIEIHYPELQ